LPTYCSYTDVLDFLVIDPNDAGVKVSSALIDNVIEQKEDYLDSVLHHAYRTIYIKEELHNFDHKLIWGAGLRIPLFHRQVHDFNDGTGATPDEVKILNNAGTYEVLAQDSYSVDNSIGSIYLRNFPILYNNYLDTYLMKISYHYGETTVPGWLKELTAKMVAVHLIRNAQQRLPFSTNDLDMLLDNLQIWQKEIEEDITRHADMVVI